MKNNCIPLQGFGLVELLLSMTLSIFLAAGAYKIVGLGAKSSLQTLQKADRKNDMDKALDFIAHKLNNSASLRHSDGTGLKVRVDSRCSTDAVSSGLVSLPEKTLEQIINLGQETVDSSLPLSPSHAQTSDALRFIYFPQDSSEIELALNPQTGKYFPTKGSTAIVIKNLGGFKLGDYAMIFDEDSNDIFRITDIEEVTGQIHLGHSIETSFWNRLIPANYGVDQNEKKLLSGAFVRKVNVITFAHSKDTQRLSFDDHDSDDGFDSIHSIFKGPVGYGFRWNSLITQVDHFQIGYAEKDEDTDWIRNPRVGDYGRANKESDAQGAKCGNQLGYPYLSFLKIDLISDQKKYSRKIDMSSLQHSASDSDELIGIQPPTPTPTPSPTPDPCPTGYTTIYANTPPPGPYSQSCSSNSSTCTQTCSYLAIEITPTVVYTSTPTPYITYTPQPTPVITPPTGGGGSF